MLDMNMSIKICARSASVLALPLLLSAIMMTSPSLANDGCRYPFVWREAFAGDHVCVTPGIRTQAQADNAQAEARVNQVNHDYGPDTCVGGYVWREANPRDHVCVTPATRSQAASDNIAAPHRYASAGAAAHRQHPARAGSYNASWQAAPGDKRCCPKNMLVCPLGRHWC
jgi:hypothetical protein